MLEENIANSTKYSERLTLDQVFTFFSYIGIIFSDFLSVDFQQAFNLKKKKKKLILKRF